MTAGYPTPGILVEMLIGATWTDITSYVMVRGDEGAIVINRGQTSEGQFPDPGSCSFQLNNRDGRFSPNNPVSPYYGLIGRNTQLRVSVLKNDLTTKNMRFWGAIPALPEDWDLTGLDVWVDVQAAGILRQLRQGSAPLGSTMYRGLTSDAVTNLVAYWPCEDGSASTSVASGIGGPPMTIFGPVNLASDTGFLCSQALPVMNSGTLTGAVPSYTVTGQSQVRFLMYLPTSLPDGTQIIKAGATGTVPNWCVTYGTGGNLFLRGFASDGTTVVEDSGAIAFGVDGNRLRVSMELTQNGANVDWILGAVNAATGVNAQLGGTFTSQTVGRIVNVQVTPGLTASDSVIGHVSVQSQVTSGFDLEGQVTAFVGETAGDRMVRLCSEQGVNFVPFSPQSADPMGAQTSNSFLNLIQECVDLDGGILVERETAFGLAYKSRQYMYNIAATALPSYTHGDLVDTPRPVPDDLNIRNDVIVSRPNGSSARVTKETGPLSVLDPPNGVGFYQDAITINVYQDIDLQQHASWRVHVGTEPSPRYPTLVTNLARPEVGSIRDFLLVTFFGSRVQVTSPPSRLGGTIDQLVIGIQESIRHFDHVMTFVCVQYNPFNVGVAGSSSVGSKADTAGSSLSAGATSTATSLSVATSTGPLWRTSGATPFNIVVSGEEITVTAVSGASSPQTFTVTRSVNGVVKAQSSGASVALFAPAIAAL